jgi:hypothetical protein
LPEVATITNAGVVTAHAGGRTRIQVALGPAHSEPLELVVADPKAPERGSVIFLGTDHGDVPTVVVADPLGDPGAVLVGGWTDGPLAHRPGVASELADYDVMLGERDAFIAEVAGDGTLGRVLQLGGAVRDTVQQIIPRADGSLLVRAVLSEPHGINYPRELVIAMDRDGHELWRYPPDQWTADLAFTIGSMAVQPNGHILVGGQQQSILLAELDPDTGVELWRWLAEGHVMGGAAGVGFRQVGVRPDGIIVIIGDDSPPWRTWEIGLDPSQIDPNYGGPKVLFYGATSPHVDLLPGPLAMAPSGPASGVFATLGGNKYGVHQDGNGLVRSAWTAGLRFGPDGQLSGEFGVDIFAKVITMAGLVIDGDGNTYLAGSFSLIEADKNEELPHEFDAFVAKLDPAGKTLWFRPVGGESNDFGHAVTLTGNGDVVMVGYTFGSIDGTALHGVPAKESCDAFLARFSPDGERR